MIERLRADNARLKGALKKHGQHHFSCVRFGSPPSETNRRIECVCGLSAALGVKHE
jgi:hypothetical protein